jgi:hypothetical protein
MQAEIYDNTPGARGLSRKTNTHFVNSEVLDTTRKKRKKTNDQLTHKATNTGIAFVPCPLFCASLFCASLPQQNRPGT